MRVKFVLPELNLTGGVRAVGIYAQLLAERGHQISIIYTNSPRAVKQTFFRKCKDLFKKKSYRLTLLKKIRVHF